MKSYDLEQFQFDFKNYLYSGATEEALLENVVTTEGVDSRLRLDIYRNAYYIRLQEALAHDYPLLLEVMGDKWFGREMAAYLIDYPSTYPSLRYIGQHLSCWFGKNNQPALSDLVQFEWAILNAFDAADTECLSGAYLQSISPVNWASLQINTRPCVTVLETKYNIIDCWQNFLKKQTLSLTHSDKTGFLIIYRSHNGPTVKSISEVSFQFLKALSDNKKSDNKNFASACNELTVLPLKEDVSTVAAQCLMQAISSGWIYIK